MSGKTSLRGVKQVAVGALLLWSLVLAGSLYWSIKKNNQHAHALVHKEAIALFNKDQGFRLWGTRHGGVYVPITERTPPSPYMAHIPERDIETPSGKKLTLMNPAYMVRELMEDYDELYGIRGKITGKVLLRPENAPDEWEWEALDKLEKGADEVLEFTEIEGAPFLRLMRPMYMKPGCDKCHGHLGFKTGDFRGGVGVSVPVTPYLNVSEEGKKTLWITHLAIWFLGIGGIGLGSKQITGRITEIDDLNQDLEARVEERTEELQYQLSEKEKAESALLDAIEEAEAANQAKSEFLSRMSHELRTPLNGVLGFAQLLEQSQHAPLTEEQARFVDHILVAGDHLLDLINEVLDLSKIETGNASFDLAQFDPQKILEESININSPLAENYDVVLVNLKGEEKDPVQVYCDESRLKQILVNLISNGIKYNKPGGTVKVSVAPSPVNEGFCRFRVEDSGIGIPNDKMEALFEPFNRLGIEKAKIDGSGIGLTITKMLVNLLGGKIGVETELGQGSTFWVDIPMSEDRTLN